MSALGPGQHILLSDTYRRVKQVKDNMQEACMVAKDFRTV